jgi:hypothetical protein
MNRLKKQSTEEPKAQKEKQESKPGIFQVWITGIMDGSFLSGENASRNIPFALFLCLLVGFYIANSYNSERIVRQTSKTGKDLKDLRSEYVSLKSELVFNSNPSQVAEKLVLLGVAESKTPPHHLFHNDSKIK